VYWVLVPEYNTFADTQHKINLDLHRLFGEEGIEFAYPTRTLFVENLFTDPPEEKDAAAPDGAAATTSPEQA
jgi:small-conductance mechanosensitive channel